MSAHSVARKYAQALFDVAARHQRTVEVSRDLAAFVDLIAQNPELQAVLHTPAVPARKKRAIIDALLASPDGRLAVEVQRVLTMLADRDRLSILASVAEAYRERVMDAERVLPAEVITAVALTEDRKQALADALGRATGRRVTIDGRIDPSILGGVVAKVGSLVFDGSVVGQLERMRQRLSTEA